MIIGEFKFVGTGKHYFTSTTHSWESEILSLLNIFDSANSWDHYVKSIFTTAFLPPAYAGR